MDLSRLEAQRLAEQFHRDGLIVIPKVLGGEALAGLIRAAELVRQVAMQLLPVTVRYWPGAVGYDPSESRERKAMASWGVDELEREELLCPELLDVYGLPPIDRMLRTLLGDRATGGATSLLWAPSLIDYDLHWHRDLVPESLYDAVAYKPMQQDQVRFYIALRPDDSLWYVPGSHRRPLTAEEWTVIREHGSGQLTDAHNVTLRAGDAAIMDAHVLHRGSSRAGSGRLSLLFSARAEWMPPRGWRTPGHWEAMTSEPFLQRLTPDARPYYARLRECRLHEQPNDYIVQAAEAAARRKR